MSVLGEVECENFVLMWRELANRGLTRDDMSHIYWAQLQQASTLLHRLFAESFFEFLSG